jgi:hypothetical protein
LDPVAFLFKDPPGTGSSLFSESGTGTGSWNIPNLNNYIMKYAFRNSGSYRYAATKSAKAAPQTFKPRFSTEEVLTTSPETQVRLLKITD